METADISKDSKNTKMGANNNSNTARMVVLQDKKKNIEDVLVKRTEELRQLCIQEAELTGIMPPEMPLEPGENYPYIRKTVGATYQLPEKLLNNDKDEIIADLELQIQLHANMAEAALGLANEQNMSKTMKRQHRSEYQKHKNRCIALQEKLATFKEKAAVEFHKQKKKPRDLSDDTLSVGTSSNESFMKSDVRHSMRSMKHSVPSASENAVEPRYSQDTSRVNYRTSDLAYMSSSAKGDDDILNTGFYRLSLQGYNKYMERRESISQPYQPSNYTITSNYYQYNFSQNSHQHSQNSIHYSQHSPLLSQHSPHISQHSPIMPQHSPVMSHHSHQLLAQRSPLMPQQSPLISQHSSHSSQYSPHMSHQHSPHLYLTTPQQTSSHSSPQHNYNYPQYQSHYPSTLSHTQTSPTTIPVKSQYYPSYTMHSQPSYRPLPSDVPYRNPHQIQPHQQYEQMSVASSGLGGCWKKSDSGELVWCNSSPADHNWQEDKRFGSLDRRRNRRITKRTPNVDPKSATLSTIPNYSDQIRNASLKTSQMVIRRSQDNGQLVRTQSLGSVGAQTVDSVYPSDDNSSCGSDNRFSQSMRKHKEKEWTETSLDGPVSPTLSVISTSQPMLPALLTPEETITSSMKQHVLRPITPKPLLEIPAESNASQRLMPDTNLEIFNNNIPKNCTVVQAGVCKPYHEETKPFEMSDFYKYSTKFKKSPAKSEKDVEAKSSYGNVSRNLNESLSEGSPRLQSYNSANNGSLDNSGNLSSMDIGQMTVSDNFSEEMKKWYKDQQQNNNNMGNPKNRSTATLV